MSALMTPVGSEYLNNNINKYKHTHTHVDSYLQLDMLTCEWVCAQLFSRLDGKIDVSLQMIRYYVDYRWEKINSKVGREREEKD